MLGVSRISQEAETIVRLSTRELVPWAGLHLSLIHGEGTALGWVSSGHLEFSGLG